MSKDTKIDVLIKVGKLERQLAQATAELQEQRELTDGWRRLAHQFDNHRMQALWFLRGLCQTNLSEREDLLKLVASVEAFRAEGPKNGDEVYEQRKLESECFRFIIDEGLVLSGWATEHVGFVGRFIGPKSGADAEEVIKSLTKGKQ